MIGYQITNVRKPLAAKLTALALREFTAETLVDKVAQAVAQGLEGDVVDDFRHEGLLQQQACLALGDASLAHVEQGGIVELSDSGSMRALHIVGIDFEHGLCVHAGFA